MQEARKNVILRVFRTAHCSPGKYILGVTCSALSILLSGVPFYTVYRIVRLFLLASLDGTAVPTGEIWLWAAVTIGSIAVAIATVEDLPEAVIVGIRIRRVLALGGTARERDLMIQIWR